MFFTESSELGPEDAASWSHKTKPDKDPNVSWQAIESWLLGAGTQPENEDYLLGISGRLQAALEKMLMAITDTTNQVRRRDLLLPSCGLSNLFLTTFPGFIMTENVSVSSHLTSGRLKCIRRN